MTRVLVSFWGVSVLLGLLLWGWRPRLEPTSAGAEAEPEGGGGGARWGGGGGARGGGAGDGGGGAARSDGGAGVEASGAVREREWRPAHVFLTT